MKKIFSLVMAMAMVIGLNAAPVALKQLKAPKSTSRMELVQKQIAHKAPMATTVTLDPATQTPQTVETDINLTINGIGVAYHGTLNAATATSPADFRIYGGKTLTLSASSNIVSVTIAGKANKAGFTLSVDNGTITTGASYTDVTEKATLEDPLIVVDDINATSVELSMGKQVRAYLIEVTLDGEVPPTPPTPVGDTTALTALDAFEFAYYGSYSTEGAYNYSLVLYNSQDEENYVPQVGFDIYTEVKDEFAGNFTAEGGNLGLEYSAFYPDADSEGEYFTDASVSITEGEGDNLIVEGLFTTEAGKTYTFSVTAEPYIYDAEHPYEPQEAKTFNLTAVSGEKDETYFGEHGLVYYFLDMEDGSIVGLTYRTFNSTQPVGTFAISDEEGVDAFLTGMDYYGDPDGSYYETIDGDVYYFVSGSVTLATDEMGNTDIIVNATSCYGSTFTVTGVIGGKQPSGDHTIVLADYAAVSFTTLDGAYTVATDKNGGTEPAYNTNGEDLRLYAKNKMTLTKNTKDGPMTEITFNISTKGLTRQAEIAVSTGKIVKYDMDNAIVVWQGEASEVTFTVGALNVYGSDGKTKAGQFDFTSIDVEGGVTGLISTKANKVASKCLINGQLMIIKNDAIYNFQGNIVR